MPRPLLRTLGLGTPGMAPLEEPLRLVARTLLSDTPPPDWQPLNSSAQARVARGRLADGTPVVMKVFLPRSRLEMVKALGRGSRGVRAARRNAALRADGFQAPRVLRHGWVRGGEVIVMEAVEGENLARLVSWRLGAPLLEPPERHRALTAFGAEIARLHQAGWIHGDLRLGNVMVPSPHPPYRFCFLDNESSQRSGQPVKRLKNLVQLNMMLPRYLPVTNRLRFLKAYVRTLGEDRTDWRSLAREIANRTATRQDERSRRGGPRRRHMVQDP